MKRVSLSLQAAKALREPYAEPWALEQLNRAIATVESPKRKAAKKTRAKATRTARETKNAETAAVRVAVFARATPAWSAAAVCELCGKAPASDLHHAFGRVRVEQSERNCLAACRSCHRDLTDNKPSAAFWWSRVAMVFRALGFAESAALAEKKALR